MKDCVEITVSAGDGGDGLSSFFRGRNIPKGGPDGGDGGRGGNVIFLATNKLNTLRLFYRKKVFKAQHGELGKKRSKKGKDGNDLIIDVPLGTIVTVGDHQYDFTTLGQRIIVAKGGRGGVGNVHFKTSTNKAPTRFTNGTPGQSFLVTLELKLIADVGLIGLPSAGKSTLLNALTNANAKTADYHFTTLEPNLGVLRSNKNGSDIVMADIPGLIQGASHGKGLGHKFLRHIERTKILIHVIDPTQEVLDYKIY